MERGIRLTLALRSHKALLIVTYQLTRDGETVRIRKLRGKLILNKSTTLLGKRHRSILKQLPFVREQVL